MYTSTQTKSIYTMTLSQPIYTLMFMNIYQIVYAIVQSENNNNQERERIKFSKTNTHNKERYNFELNRIDLLSGMFSIGNCTSSLAQSVNQIGDSDMSIEENDVKDMEVEEEIDEDEALLINFLNKDSDSNTSKQISEAIRSLHHLEIKKLNIKKNYSILFSNFYQLLPNPTCIKCGTKMSLGRQKKYLEDSVWRCYSKKCNRRRICLYDQHPLFQTFKISLSTLLKLFIFHFPNQSEIKVIENELGISQYQISKGRKLWQKVIQNYYMVYYQELLLGENSEVVEADEACFKRKFNKGRILKRSQWVFGLTERSEGFERTLLIPVENRKAETLCPLIKSFVSPNTTMIITDKWRAYLSLKNLGFQHFTVNHRENKTSPNYYVNSSPICQVKYNIYITNTSH
ncbi:hypothetical protein ABPG72_018362 [Tetrahymena utriculariae]